MRTTSVPEQIELRTLEDAVHLLDQWIEAYRELQREHVRLQSKFEDVEFWRKAHLASLEHLDPFLPAHLQNPDLLRKRPRLYAAIAQHVEELVPF